MEGRRGGGRGFRGSRSRGEGREKRRVIIYKRGERGETEGKGKDKVKREDLGMLI